MKVFIVLACIVAITVAKATDQKKAKDSKNPICSKKLTVKPSDCCPGMPSLKQFFDACSAQCNQTLSADASTSTAAPKKRGKGEKEGKDSGHEQFFKCLMPCVIQSAGIAGPDGNISSDLLTNQLLNGASSDWASIVPNVVSACFANATAMAANKGKGGKGKDHDFAKMNSDTPHNCSRINGMVMMCVFKNLYLQCPAPVSSADCTDLTTKMSQCPCNHGKGEENEDGKSEKKGKQEEKKGGKNEKQQEGKKGQEKGEKGKGRGKQTTTTEEPVEA